MTCTSSRSPTKSIANTVCPIYLRSCLNLDRSPLPQGWRTFNITLNHPASRFLRHPAILPFEPRTFTHNTTCVPMVAYPKADLVDDNPDLVDVGAFGMGAIWMGMGGAHDGITQIKVRAILGSLPYAFLTLTSWRIADGASLFYTTPQPMTLNIPRQDVPQILFGPPALLRQCVANSHSFTS